MNKEKVNDIQISNYKLNKIKTNNIDFHIGEFSIIPFIEVLKYE